MELRQAVQLALTAEQAEQVDPLRKEPLWQLKCTEVDEQAVEPDGQAEQIVPLRK